MTTSDEPTKAKLPAVLTDSSRTFYSRNEQTNLIELIDILTGSIVAVQASTEDLFKNASERFIEMIIPGENGEPDRIVYVQKGLPMQELHIRQTVAYSDVLADLIVDRYIAGETLNKICRIEGYPSYPLLVRWRNQFPDFREKLAAAKRDRADHFADKVIDTVDQVKKIKHKRFTEQKDGAPDLVEEIEVDAPWSSEETANRKLQVENYKWVAGVSNPDSFGNRTKLVGDANSPIGFIVDTGIRRKGDAGFGEKDITPGVSEISGVDACEAVGEGEEA